MGQQAQQLAEENSRLKQECERLGRVIDSGDWGRQRVQELLQAGQVLREERDGLARLVGAMQAQQAQGPPQQEQHALPVLSCNATELAELQNGTQASVCAMPGGKESPLQQGRLLNTVSCAAPQVGLCSSLQQPASPGKAAEARNRLLVQSGSSFNALVRLSACRPNALVRVGAFACRHQPCALAAWCQGMWPDMSAVCPPSSFHCRCGRSSRTSCPLAGYIVLGLLPCWRWTRRDMRGAARQKCS